MNADQNGFAPTVWGSWTNSGQPVTSTVTGAAFRSWRGNTLPGGWGRAIDQNTTITTTQNQTRSGIRTQVVARIDRESIGETVVKNSNCLDSFQRLSM